MDNSKISRLRPSCRIHKPCMILAPVIGYCRLCPGVRERQMDMDAVFFSPQRSGSPPNNTFPSLPLPSLPPPPSAYRFNEPVLIAFLPSPFSFSRHIHSSAGQASGVGRGGGASLRLFFLIESLSQCSERPETRSLVSTAAPPATMRARLFFACTNQSIFDGGDGLTLRLGATNTRPTRRQH